MRFLNRRIMWQEQRRKISVLLIFSMIFTNISSISSYANEISNNTFTNYAFDTNGFLVN